MEKRNGKILIALSVFSLSLLGGLSISQTVKAENGSVTPSQKSYTNELITPTSYEQYLDLTAPIDVAVNERYTAIADGNTIYVYDTTTNLYREYAHANYKVAKMQFSDSGSLYFADETAKLYQLDPFTVKLTSPDPLLHCSTFSLSGNDIYYSIVAGNISRLFKAPLTDIANEEMLSTPDVLSDTVFSVCDEEIFYTHSGQFLLKYPSVGDPTVAFFQNVLTSVVATPSHFYCADVTGAFYVYDFIDLYAEKGNAEPIFSAQGNYSKLTYFDGFVYAIDGSSVRQYSIEKETFTDFEICASSASENRLNGATDLILFENKLITADEGNERISIRNPDGSYQIISTKTELAGNRMQSLTATENTVLVTTEHTAYLYDLENGLFLEKFEFGEQKLTGAVGVYGKYYFTTNANAYYFAEKTSTNETDFTWSLSTPVTKSGASPTHLATDVYGYLYVARAGNLYKYDETGFLEKENAGELLYPIPATTKKISVDYNGLAYAQTTDNAILVCSANGFPALTIPSAPVYSHAEQALTAIAFGVEDSAPYYLFNGNYILQSNTFEVPTVKTIAVNGLAEKVFETASAEFSVVKTDSNALLVEIDFNSLKGSTYFPYLSYERSKTERTALNLGTVQNGEKTHRLLAEYDQAKNKYRTYLVLDAQCETLAESDYMTTFDATTPQYGYTTNSVHLYKFPYLTSLMTVTELDKNAKVLLLGEITQLDHDYYLVSIQTADGEKTGYIPKAYVTDYDGSTPVPNDHLLGGEPADTDMIWRLAYIVCGLLAICVLADYLILRKRK